MVTSKDATGLACPVWGPQRTRGVSPLLTSAGIGERQDGTLKPSCLAQVVRYEAGYVVCAVIAGLYLLLVPITGLCFCCCRCRRRCGGRVKTEHKTMACERGTLMTFLLLTTLVLL